MSVLLDQTGWIRSNAAKANRGNGRAGNRAIFDIGGNRFRLVVKIVDDVVGLVLIRFVGTHAAYDRIDAKTI
jgi:mRNA interferase HigB